ncbi:MAG TPA: threonine ammonia-lyase IlvA [Chitinophagaceae bacterium]|nr:threonine ammonia-lyase IlvA [Chitinophagaceae bacterium]
MQTVPTIKDFNFKETEKELLKVVKKTPLERSNQLSKKYNCNVYLKREDLQIVRSYKMRGAYNLMSKLPEAQRENGVVCASAGNHAQGFAFSCNRLRIKGVVFMPIITSRQKIDQVKMFGGEEVDIKLIGDTFDDCLAAAIKYKNENKMTFVPPFDDERIIEGQGTVGVEILEDLPEVDYLFIPVGGGGLASGVSTYFREVSPHTKLIGAEPMGAPSLTAAKKAGHPVTLNHIERFVDGAAVKRIGELTFSIIKDTLDDVDLVSEGKTCSAILELYNKNAIVAEPAGVLSIASLDTYAEEIKGKNVVCIISGGNNDIDRMQEIKERSLLYEGLKHYFIVNFTQRPGSLKLFVNSVLGPDDDITRFEYMYKYNKESGPALVGIELSNPNDYRALIQNLNKHNFSYTELEKEGDLFGYIV